MTMGIGQDGSIRRGLKTEAVFESAWMPENEADPNYRRWRCSWIWLGYVGVPTTNDHSRWRQGLLSASRTQRAS